MAEEEKQEVTGTPETDTSVEASKKEPAAPEKPEQQKTAEKTVEQPAEEGKKDAEKPAEKAEAKTAAEEKKKEEPKELTAKDLLQTEATPAKRAKIKGAKNVPLGIAHITATFNNTVVTITDMKGAVISWSTGGRCGFKGSRKSTAYAATMVAQDAGRQAVGHGMHELEVRVQGPGAGRESAIRALQAVGLNVTSIKDVTPIPHNGCRPPKRRRV
jgi:small subunit ribosomal protein S11